MSRSLVADLELDLGALSELFDGDLLGMFALDFAEEMEVGIQLLCVVLVGVRAQLVVIGALVLPLLVWLHVQELHEGIELHLVEFIS